MTNERDKAGDLLPDDRRLTEFGEFLRVISLDGFPEPWNVLTGAMNLLGPRPLLVECLQLYSDEEARRYDVRFGIARWAQVDGGNAISWENKFKRDAWDVDNQTFWPDIKILFLTVKKVFFREGVSQEGWATIDKFAGDQRILPKAWHDLLI